MISGKLVNALTFIARHSGLSTNGAELQRPARFRIFNPGDFAFVAPLSRSG
jgi:hypothetical protein